MPQMQIEDPQGSLAMLRDSVRGFAEHHPGAATLRAKRAANEDLSRPVWKAMTEAGWTGLLLPEDLGGLGLGLAELAVLGEALGRELICEPFVASAVVPATWLGGAPDSAERARLAEGLVSGSLIIGSAWREPPAYARANRVFARPRGDDLVLEGQAHFVEAAKSATDFLVVAHMDNGAALLSIPGEIAGLTKAERPGVDGAALASLSFADVRVANHHILARADDLDSLVAEPERRARLALAAELAGLGCRALEMTIDYTKDRVQFGKPIASFQAIQHRLVEMWSDAEFACAAVVNAIEVASRGEPKATDLAILAAKARAGDSAFSICRRAIHLHGAMGITDESNIGLYLKRALNLNATLGQPEELRLQFVARERAA